jgi:hypothetical protein
MTIGVSSGPWETGGAGGGVCGVPADGEGVDGEGAEEGGVDEPGVELGGPDGGEVAGGVDVVGSGPFPPHAVKMASAPIKLMNRYRLFRSLDMVRPSASKQSIIPKQSRLTNRRRAAFETKTRCGWQS